MIGLVDLNFQRAKKALPPPNLEIMKLAEYYKLEENQFCRIISLDETEFGGYDKIYIFSENDQCVDVPEAFRRAQNVIYGGSAFTNKVYIPFQNDLIDFTLPRPNIYTRLLKEKYAAGTAESEISHILDDAYYRRFAGEQELPVPPINRRKRVYIYDRNFFQPGWEPIIEDIMEHKPTSINLIHAVHFSRLSDFFAVRENDIIAKKNDVFLDLDIPLKETAYMMRTYKNRLLALIRPNSAIYLSLGGTFHYRTDYYKNFIYKLNLLYEFWANKIPIKIKYESPSLGCYDPIAALSQEIAKWTCSPLKQTRTILEKWPKETKLDEIKLAQEQSAEFIRQFPQQAILLKQTSEQLEKGGRWNK